MKQKTKNDPRRKMIRDAVDIIRTARLDRTIGMATDAKYCIRLNTGYGSLLKRDHTNGTFDFRGTWNTADKYTRAEAIAVIAALHQSGAGDERGRPLKISAVDYREARDQSERVFVGILRGLWTTRNI